MKVKKLTIASFILFFSLFFVFPSNSVGITDPDSIFEIGPNNYKAVYWISIPADYLITVEVEVTGGGDKEINVYLCDSDGYYEFQNEASFTAKKIYEGISYLYFEYTTTYEDGYYIILKNPAIVFTKTVELKTSLSIIEEKKSISITSPSSTTSYYIEEDGSQVVPIQWDTTGDITYVVLELYYGSTLVETLASWTDNDGYYLWTIYYSDGYEGSSYKIKVSDYYDDTIYDYSDYYFEIDLAEEKSLTITYYNYDLPSRTISFGWDYTGDITYVEIELYQGSTYIRTIESLSDVEEDYYVWDMPDNLGGSNYRIKISDYYDSSVYDYSAYFELEKQGVSRLAISGPSPLVILLVTLGCVVIGAVLLELSFIKKQQNQQKRNE